jgi:hypothetical protein
VPFGWHLKGEFHLDTTCLLCGYKLCVFPIEDVITILYSLPSTCLPSWYFELMGFYKTNCIIHPTHMPFKPYFPAVSDIKMAATWTLKAEASLLAITEGSLSFAWCHFANYTRFISTIFCRIHNNGSGKTSTWYSEFLQQQVNYWI